jgi:PAS domain S-box-containing protein
MAGADVANASGESIMRASLDGIAIVRDGQYARVNDRFCSLHGFESESDVLDREVGALCTDASADQLRERRRSLEPGAEWRGEVRAHRRDGDSFARRTVLRRVDPQTCICVARDESQRSREQDPERGLAEREAGVVLLDETNTIREATDAVEDLTGYDAATLVGDPVTRLLAMDDAEQLGATDARSGSTQSLTIETAAGEHLPVEGTFEPAEAAPGARRLVLSASTTEETVSGLQAQHDQLVQTAPVPIGIVSQDFELRQCNQATAEFLNARDPASLVGSSVFEFTRAVDEPTLRERLRAVFDEGTPTEPTEEQLRAVDGETKVARVTTTPITYRGELAAQVTLNDVTDFKRTQTALAEKQRFVENIIDSLDDILFVIDENGEMVHWNDRICDRLGYAPAEIESMDPFELIAPSARQGLPGDREAIVDMPERVELSVVTKSGERIPHEFRGLTLSDEVTGRQYRCGIARDVTERLAYEAELERQRDELKMLNNINELLVDITRSLVETPTRAAVEETVCERLVRSDLYELAWTADAVTDDRIDVQASASQPATTLEPPASHVTSAACPARHAVQSGEVTVVENGDGPEWSCDWLQEHSDGEWGGIAMVPLTHGDATYGVLAVYSDRSTGFTKREQAGFEMLGETIGFVSNAIESQKLLVADIVTELEFEISGGPPLFDVARDLDCTLWLRGYITSSMDQWTCYVDVEGAPVDAFRAELEAVPSFEELRVICDDADATSLQLTFTSEPFPESVISGNRKLQHGYVRDGEARILIETPQTNDVRDVVRHVRATFERATLCARRERDRSVQTATDLRDTVEDRLTERQYTALKTAYLAGYYNWPSRDSTAEDVAADLGVSSATLHGHIRKAIRDLLDVFFPTENPEQS